MAMAIENARVRMSYWRLRTSMDPIWAWDGHGPVRIPDFIKFTEGCQRV